MTIGKELLTMTPEEFLRWVEGRREGRLVTPKRRPTRLTPKALSRAWNVPEPVIRAVIEERMKKDEK